MPQRKLTIRNNQVEDLFAKSTYKAKPKPYVEPEFITTYRANRDSILNELYSDSTATQLCKEMADMGFKSAKTAKVVTVQQDKANRASKHAEITLQAQFCKWVSKEYPELKYLRHEREKARSNFMGNQMKVMNSAGAMPDWELVHTPSLYIEFKRPGENWLMVDGKTIKAQYAHQYHNHCLLWDNGKVVYFCNDLEIAKQILIQFLAGRNMRQRIYTYPEKFKHLER